MKQYMMSIFSIVVAFALSIWFSPQLPNEIAIHWGINGEADGFAGKAFVFLLPILMLGLVFFKWLMPKLDPKKENYEKFSKPYHITTELVTVFLLVMHIACLFYNLGHDINIERITLFSIGFLFVTLGNYLPKVKRNYFLGIRTPWTLESEHVWQKTHRTGGRWFVYSGLVLIIGTLLPVDTWVLLSVALLPVFALVGISYYYYKQEKKLKTED